MRSGFLRNRKGSDSDVRHVEWLNGEVENFWGFWYFVRRTEWRVLVLINVVAETFVSSCHAGGGGKSKSC